MTTVDIMSAVMDRVKSVFPTAVLTFRNGSYECECIRHTRSDESIIDPNTGRVDPDRFIVRVKVAECGPVKGGDVVRVGDDACAVEDIVPDAIGLSLLLNLRRKRVSP